MPLFVASDGHQFVIIEGNDDRINNISYDDKLDENKSYYSLMKIEGYNVKVIGSDFLIERHVSRDDYLYELAKLCYLIFFKKHCK